MLPVQSRPRTHTGKPPTLDAVNGLPVVVGKPQKELPAPARTVDAETVRQLAEGMTPKTWRKLRGELLALAKDVSQSTR